jgi:hypothetical protein
MCIVCSYRVLCAWAQFCCRCLGTLVCNVKYANDGLDRGVVMCVCRLARFVHICTV